MTLLQIVYVIVFFIIPYDGFSKSTIEGLPGQQVRCEEHIQMFEVLAKNVEEYVKNYVSSDYYYDTSYGKVVMVEEKNAVGDWIKVRCATAGSLIYRGEELSTAKEVDICINTEVYPDDFVTTATGRVTVATEDGSFKIMEKTTVRLKDWGISHEIGAVILAVEDYFRIEFGTAEAVVDGTIFMASKKRIKKGIDRFITEIFVTEGSVRLKNSHGEVSISVGQKGFIIDDTRPPKLEKMSQTELNKVKI